VVDGGGVDVDVLGSVCGQGVRETPSGIVVGEHAGAGTVSVCPLDT
jgi:hypothetical protein